MQNKNLSVGIFVVGGLLLFGLGLFVIGDQRRAFGRHMEYYAEFTNMAGLAKGAKVRVGGMDAGQVVEIAVPDSPARRFRVRWRIDANLSGLVRADSLATVDTEGVVGGTYLSVKPGSAKAPEASALSTIPSREPIELSDILGRGDGLLTDTRTAVQTLGGKLGVTLDTMNSTISNVNDIAVGLKAGHGPAGMLLTDDALASQLHKSVANTTTNVDRIVSDLQAGRGAAGMLLRDDALARHVRDTLSALQQASTDLGHASRQADALVSDLAARQLPQKAEGVISNLDASAQQVRHILADASQPDRQGLTAGANIRESLSNVNAATSNLADDSEALKHNFLLRGFFRRRGYFNLDRISPEQYRKDRAFTNASNYRAWLPASTLFQNDSQNSEQLTPAGGALLEDALTKYGDGVVDSPIVIEGYGAGGNSGDSLWRSRSRAILVRDQLQKRLHLDLNNLGTVGLKHTPPPGVGQTAWDGICIVVLRSKSN